MKVNAKTNHCCTASYCPDFKLRFGFFLFKVEPFYITLSLFDIQNGRKISSDFYVDLNHPSVRGMLPNNSSHYMNGGNDARPEGQRLIHGVPEAALQYPRQVDEFKTATSLAEKLAV